MSLHTLKAMAMMGEISNADLLVKISAASVVSWIVFTGVFAVLAYRVDRLCSEVEKLNEFLRRPAGVQASEVRISPAVAYSATEGGKTPDWLHNVSARQLRKNGLYRVTRR